MVLHTANDILLRRHHCSTVMEHIEQFMEQ